MARTRCRWFDERDRAAHCRRRPARGYEVCEEHAVRWTAEAVAMTRREPVSAHLDAARAAVARRIYGSSR